MGSIKIIKEVNKEEFRDFLYNIDIRDNALYKEIMNPGSIGIFQFNGNTAAKLTKEIAPTNFEEMTAVNALSRPGPIDVAAPYYVERKNGAPSPYPEQLNDIIENTHNTIIFQEQIMSIFHNIGGFTLEEADEVRGLMKKLGKAEKKQSDIDRWEEVVKKFTSGAKDNGIKEGQAKRIAADVVAFSAYSFNKSHAVSYTYIAVMTLYLSYYFRKFFYSSILNYEIDRDKDVINALNSVKTQGFDILQPNINKSAYSMSAEKNDIMFGLSNIKFVGEKPIQKIIENRPYSNLFEFVMKTRSREVSSKVIKALISVGAFDEISTERKKLLWVFEQFWVKKKSIKLEDKLKFIWETIEKDSERAIGLKMNKTDLRKYEKDFLGFNFFTSMFDNKMVEAFRIMKQRHLINFSFDDIGELSKKVPVCVNSFRTLIDKNDNKMAFLDVEDPTGAKEIIPVFASYWKHIEEEFEFNEIYLINCYRNDDSILFGQKAWETSGAKIKRMVKKIQ